MNAKQLKHKLKCSWKLNGITWYIFIYLKLRYHNKSLELHKNSEYIVMYNPLIYSIELHITKIYV